MIYRSNRELFLVRRYVALVFAYVFAGLAIYLLSQAEGRPASIFPLFFSAFAFVINAQLKREMVEVEIDEHKIVLLNKNREVSWFDVQGIYFNMFGLYVLQLKDASYIFVPYGIVIHIFGFQLNQSDMDVLIEKKKRQMKI